jgi:translation initiation factor IF-1
VTSEAVAVDELQGTDHTPLVQEGIVEAQLPSGLYRVDVDGNRAITAYIGGGLERKFVRLLVGDRVVVELVPRDLTRGRIIRKA